MVMRSSSTSKRNSPRPFKKATSLCSTICRHTNATMPGGPLRGRGAWLLFLPPYSPDFNPIELAFSKFKAHMKRLKPRTVDDLWKAAGRVCNLFKPEEGMNFFAADGYAPE